MNKVQIDFFLKNLSTEFLAPVIYFDNNGIISSYQPYEFNGRENQFTYILNRLKPKMESDKPVQTFFDINKHLVLIGIVALRMDGREEYVLFGPVASNACTDENVHDYLVESGLSLEAVKIVSDYMTKNKRMMMEQFLSVLSTITLVMSGETQSVNEFVNLSSTGEFVDHMLNSNPVAASFDEGNETVSDSYEQEEMKKRVHFCMKNGLVELLPTVLQQFSTLSVNTGDGLHNDPLENNRLLTIGELFSAYSVAMDEGVSLPTIDNLKHYYYNKITLARYPNEFHRINVDILFEFTKTIRDHRSYSTENATINRVIRYIQNNISSKLLVDDIAKALHVSSNYIFTRFKSEMNMTVNDFITQEKVRKAEYYLIFTDKSLIEISEYLGFSSQSYFQTVFKKIKGMTPSKFRTANK